MMTMITLKSPAATLLASLTLALAALAEEAPAPAKPEESAKPAVREVSPGVFEVGKVRLDQKALTVSFSGKVNMERGLLEYLIVNPKGSAHESLLVTEVSATDIHTAMLLLGAKSGAITADAPPTQLNDEFLRTAPKLTGDSVFISVKWKEKGVEKTVPVEDWLSNQEKKQAIEHGPWIYNGSLVYEGRFLAQVDGNLVALVTMPSALLNNPRKNNNHDQMWNVNEKDTPKVNTPVEIIFKLVPPADSKTKK